MSVKTLFIYFGKLLLSSLAFSVGVMIGGMVVNLLGLQPPQVPEGFDTSLAMQYMLLESPLLALALAMVARGIAGGFLTRTFVLSLLTWIAYTVNTQLEATIFTDFGGGFWYTVIDFGIASLLSGVAAAWLFPSGEKGEGIAAAWKGFFGQRTTWDWIWRLAVAAVAFMPIYYFFGLLVVPFTGEYYQRNMYGLQMPGLDQILMVLLLRSVLFLLACLPVIILWRKGRLSLFLSLGFALFVLVGLLNMLVAYWMPVSVRLPHTLEILADEFVYAGVLVALLKRGRRIPELITASQALR